MGKTCVRVPVRARVVWRAGGNGTIADDSGMRQCPESSKDSYIWSCFIYFFGGVGWAEIIHSCNSLQIRSVGGRKTHHSFRFGVWTS